MKKAILVLTSTFVVLNFTACSSKETLSKIEGQCIIQGTEAPDWACGAYEEPNRYTAVGSAYFSKLGQNFSRNEAILNARANLVNKIELDVKTKTESYMRSIGLGENEMAERVVTQVTKQTTGLTIKDSKQISYWQNSSTNEIYVLIAIDKNNVNKIIEKDIKSVVDHELQLKNSEDALNNIQ